MKGHSEELAMESGAKDGRQSVVVILDASKDERFKEIQGVLKEFSLKPRDDLFFIAVLHQVNSPSTFSFVGAVKAVKRMGYKVNLDSDSFVGTNQRIAEDARVNKEKEYMNKKEIISISEQCQTEKIGFEVMVLPGKMDAIHIVEALLPTRVILDKEMKKAKKFFLERLSCNNISRIKQDNSLESLRGPKEIGNSKPTEGSTKQQADGSTRGHVTYAEMIPGSPKGKHYHHKSSKERASIHKENARNKEGERAERSEYDGRSPEVLLENPDNSDWMGECEIDEDFISTCSKCDNKRPNVGWKKEFTYGELYAATRGFSKMNFLSEGGFGSVFKGVLNNGLNIAVKQHKSASLQGDREFEAELHFLSKAVHENLVMLLGSCSEGSNRLLVYEYVCNGSLDQHLSKHARKPLSWDERMKIATGAARGLHYLHQNNIVHRDIRPNNILLTHDYDTLLGDFGLARAQEEDHSSVTRVVGTLGYLAPEYAESGKISTMTDVYAFGVILLQLITGRGTNDKNLEGRSLVGWARPLLKDRNYPDLIDPNIMDSHDFHQLFWMIRVAEKCLSKDPQKRLAMEKVVDAINYLRESDSICHIKLSPAHSDASLCSGQCSPGANADEEDEYPNFDMETKLMYDHMSRIISQSSSTPSTSSDSSSMFMVSAVSSSESRDYHQS